MTNFPGDGRLRVKLTKGSSDNKYPGRLSNLGDSVAFSMTPIWKKNEKEGKDSGGPAILLFSVVLLYWTAPVDFLLPCRSSTHQARGPGHGRGS